MKRKTPPENWYQVFHRDPETMVRLMMDPIVRPIVQKANSEYVHWEKIRHYKLPKKVTADQIWTLIKMARNSNRESLPIVSEDKVAFNLCSFKEQYKELSFIDSHASGTITSIDNMPTPEQSDKLVISGLMEEAISSSQLEGANTTRKAAKAMIEFKLSPKNKDERMILNNYLAMTKLEEWKQRPLDEGFLLELHSVLTEGTMDRESEVGRFRADEDEVVVVDKVTGEVVHAPPSETGVSQQLRQLFEFASDETQYLHPFVKASILHFAIGYIHPFVDGNGRCARAVFYWYLIKKNYWMFKFLPLSLQIKKKDWRPGYDRAFQNVESDDLDLTYFINYKIALAKNAIEDLRRYLIRKEKEANSLKNRLVLDDEINTRQLEIIAFLQSHPNSEIDVEFHRSKFNVVYQTARTDLLNLANLKILKAKRRGRKFLFSRGERFPSK